MGGGSECIVGLLESDTCGPGGAFRATSTTPELNSLILESTLSGIATMALDGTLVECFEQSADNMVGKSVLQTVGQYMFTSTIVAKASRILSQCTNCTEVKNTSGQVSHNR